MVETVIEKFEYPMSDEALETLLIFLGTKVRSATIGQLQKKRGLKRHDAEVAVQEALMKACRKLKKGGRGPKNAKSSYAWLLKVALRKYLDEQKKQKRRAPHNDAYAALKAPILIEAATVDKVIRHETITAVRAAINDLPSELTMIATLHYDGCSMQEIADTLSISAHAVRKSIKKIYDWFYEHFEHSKL